MIATHAALTAALGQVYGKLGIPVGEDTTIYVTEIALGLALLFGAGALRGRPWDRLDRLLVLLLGLAAVWLVAGGSNPAGLKAFSFFIYAGFFFLVRALVVTEDDRRVLTGVVAGGALVGAALGLWNMWTEGAPIYETNELTVQVGFLATPSETMRWLSGEFGLYGMCAMLIVVADMVLTRRVRRFHVAVVVAALIEMTLVQHRSVVVALPFALFTMMALLPRWRDAIPALRKVLIVALAGLIVMIVTLGEAYLEGFLVRMAETGDTSELNAAWRLLAWAEVVQGILESPLGHGFAQWDFAFNAYDPLSGSHNSFLDLTYRVGVPGLVLLVLALAWAYRQAKLASQLATPGPALSLVASGACVMACVIYACFNVVLETPYLAVFFWLFLGLVASHFPSGTRVAAA